MKKYTQADFDNFEVDDYGHKICPAGDYTAIKSYGEVCSFDEWCHFGKRCSYENGTVKKWPLCCCGQNRQRKPKNLFLHRRKRQYVCPRRVLVFRDGGV